LVAPKFARPGLGPAAVVGVALMLVASTYAYTVVGRPAAPRPVTTLSTPTPASEKSAMPSPVAPVPMPPPPAPAKAAASPATRPEQAGWVEIASDEPVEIRELDRVLIRGTSGRVKLNAGTHNLRIVNQSAGVDLRRTVQISAGKVTNVDVPAQRGVVAINATPWAEVWIDGHQVGQTPLSNIPVTAGLHTVMFRHPSLGERRRTITIPASGSARISVDLRQ
jgi:hypothetical protein